MPKISVVMPTYNAEKYLAEAILDILNQTFDDFELLIVNEFGSDDKTVEIAESFDDSRIRIIQNFKREGISESLNIGIRASKGEYIARADADDRYEANRFEEQVRFLDENQDITVLGTWYEIFGDEELIDKWIFNQDKTEYLHKYYPTKHDDIKALLLFFCPICHPTVMFRKKDLIDYQLCYKPDIVSEDCELWSRACHLVKFANLPKILCRYRFSGDNSTFQRAAEGRAIANKCFAEKMQEYLYIDKEKYKLLDFSNNLVDYFENANKLLEEIWAQNEKLKVYSQESLMRILELYWERLYLKCRNVENVFIESLKNKRVCLYGAGIFAEELLAKYDFSKFNIVGFLDINRSKVGQSLKGYEIFHKESITELNPDVIIITLLEPFYIYYDLISEILVKDLNIMVVPNFVDIVRCRNIYEKSKFYKKY